MIFDLETRLEQESPKRLQGTLQESLDGYRPQCHECGLVMHRHHRFSGSIATRYGLLELQIPVSRCGECHSITSGAELLGDENATAGTRKNRRMGREAGCPGTELRPVRAVGGLRNKHPVPLGQPGAARQPVLSGKVGEVEGLWTRTSSGSREVRVIRDERGTALGSFDPWAGVIDQAWRQEE